jgi:ferric-dicitrate binding protein FerR (iron transport regulator)
MDVSMNSDSAIDMDMLDSERTKFVRLELGRIMINNETSVSRFVVVMMTFTVRTTKVFVDNHFTTFLNELKIH